MRPREYLMLKNTNETIINNIREQMHIAKKYVEIPNIKNLRKMETSDVFVGQMVFYNNEDGWFWHIIEEVYDTTDQFKSYCCEYGCRYGIDGKYVEVR